MNKKQTDKVTEKMSIKEKQLKNELSHFRRLNMMIFGLLVIVILSFGALFSMMYLEVRMMCLQLQNVYDSLIVEINQVDDFLAPDLIGLPESFEEVSTE